MSNWTSGYVADIDYTYGYYAELNPQRVKLAFLNQGLKFPEIGTACELGFGQGISTNFHSAASVTSWFGTDFNPAQASFAQELTAVSGSKARLFDESFVEFASRSDLPEFDYIGLHGIWSWINDENRDVIVNFIRTKLKVGGVLYISYNTLPGWASFAPMRHLMSEHAEVLGTEGRGIVSRIEGAMEFAEKLLSTDPMYCRANLHVTDRLKKMQGNDRHYLAHEYFNRDWHPIHFATMGKWLEEAKVQYACSANLLDHIDALNLTDDQQKFLSEIHDPMFRQTTRDFMVNQQFRKDYWVKGNRKISPLEQAEQLRNVRIMLTTPKKFVSLKVSGALGEATLAESIYNPILDALSDYKPRTINQLEKDVKTSGVTFAQLLQAVIILTGAGHISPICGEPVQAKIRQQTDQLNKHLMQKSRSCSDVQYLVSPVTGGGIQVNRISQLFILALQQGAKGSEDLAQFAWNILSAQSQKLIKDSKTLDSDEANFAELLEQAIAFKQNQLPILKELMIT